MNPIVYNTSEICYAQGVRYAVFSPGSRNAPLSISFHRNKKIKKYVFVDERSAGFIALGIAQRTQTPVVLCCTSGTALLNYMPAIAEAFYQNVPLIVCSADRPPEWIDQWDGQTIQQQNIFTEFTKGFFQLPTETEHPDAIWEYERKIKHAIALATANNPAPVHINFPFREPFYPVLNDILQFDTNIKPLTLVKNSSKLQDESQFLEKWNHKTKKIIVAGDLNCDEEDKKHLERLISKLNLVVVAEVHSNLQGIDGTICYSDFILKNFELKEQLKPDLVISIGKSLISKRLKNLIKKSDATHWKINPFVSFEDTFQKLENIFNLTLSEFLQIIDKTEKGDEYYFNQWQNANNDTIRNIENLSLLPYCEFQAFNKVIQKLPDNCNLFLSNSMPIRYANIIGVSNKSIEILCNRGTSGIDGTNGICMGHTLTCSKKTILLTGDLSFLYDRNAFLHSYNYKNLHIIVFNNFGGGIFELIPDSQNLTEEEKSIHFITPHKRNFYTFAQEFGFEYQVVKDNNSLENSLEDFFNSTDNPKLLEIQTDISINKQFFNKIMKE